MAEPSLPSPPQTPASPIIEPDSSQDPLAHLDALLASYLELLDAYSTLRSELSKTLGGGFLALANANRTSNLGSGRRYGEEGYDERMKSGRRVRIVEATKGHDGELPKKKISATEEDERGNELQSTVDEAAATTKASAYVFTIQPTEEEKVNIVQDTEKPNTEDGSQPSSPLPSSALPDPTSNSNSGSKPKSKSKSKPKPRNPLNWYGILVPPSLRQAQSSFTSAVTTSIPQLLTVSGEMQVLEARITELRAELGLTTSPADHTDSKNESQQQQASELGGKSSSKKSKKASIPISSSSSNLATALAERPAIVGEPLRPRVLKLD